MSFSERMNSKKEPSELNKKYSDILGFIIKPYNFYHCNYKSYDSKKLLECGVKFIIASVIVISLFNGWDFFSSVNRINKWYPAAFLLSIGIFLVYTSGYIYGDDDFTSFRRGISTFFYWVVITFSLIVFIPPLFILLIFNAAFCRDAKRIFSIECVLLFFSLDLWIEYVYFLILLCFDKDIEFFMTIAKRYGLKWVTIELFIELLVIEVIIMLVNKICIELYKKRKNKEALEQVNNLQNESIELNMKDYVYTSNDYYVFGGDSIIADPQSELEYDIKFIKYSLFKLNFFLVIILFVWATISNDSDLKTLYPDISNVLTCFSLMMLYFDKNKEWSKF